MRKVRWTLGNFVHLTRRVVRGLPMAPTDEEKDRHLLELFYMNDSHSNSKVMRDVLGQISSGSLALYEWPTSWPKRDPITRLCAFCLNYNHDHNIAVEIVEGGISKFMHDTGISKAKYHNEKYGDKGSFFQGPYDARVIESYKYLRWVIPYVMCKNTFEMHPRGYDWCKNNFDEAWEWSIHYPYSSLGVYAGIFESPIIDPNPLREIVGSPNAFYKLCRDMIDGRKVDKDILSLDIDSLSFE